jgi:hypothetical protein
MSRGMSAVAGRAIVSEPFDGRLLGAEFWRIRPPVPEFMVFGAHVQGHSVTATYTFDISARTTARRSASIAT